MVWGAEGAALDERRIGGELVSHRVNAGDIQGFVYGQRRQDTRQGVRQQRFTRPGRAYHQHVRDNRPSHFL